MNYGFTRTGPEIEAIHDTVSSLPESISGYSQLTFSNIENLKLGVLNDGKNIDISSLTEGVKVNWLGYYSRSDGGSNWGVVKKGAHVDDGGSIFSIDANTYIEANLKGNRLNTFKFGMLPSRSASEIEATLIAADAYASSNDIPLYVPSGVYNIAPTQDIKILSKKFSGDGYVSFSSTDPATVFVTTTDFSLFFDGNLRELEKFTVRNEKINDNCSGVKLRDFQFSVIRDVSVVAAKRGFEILVRDDSGNSAGTFSSKFDNIITLSCKCSLFTGGNELNSINFKVAFSGTYNPSNPWEWAGNDPAEPSYGFFIDTSFSDENSIEYFVQSLNISGTVERHKYGAAVHVFCNEQSVNGGSPKSAVNIRNINLDGLYAERCKDVLFIDAQDKGRVQGLSLQNVNASANEDNATSIATLLGATGAISTGAYRGVYLDSKTCNVGWNGSANAAFKKFNVDGIGESNNNDGVSLNGNLLVLPLIFNDGQPITATGSSVDVKVELMGAPFLRRGFNHKINAVSITADRQITAGGADAVRILPTGSDFLSFSRDDYNNQDTTSTLITPLVRVSDSSNESEQQNSNGTKFITTSTSEQSAGITYINGLAKFGNGYENSSPNDRILSWPVTTNCRVLDATLQNGDLTLKGYIEVEVWEDE